MIYSSEDLGNQIRSFFERISYISDNEIYKIMSYLDPENLELNDHSAKVIIKHINSNSKQIRRMLKQVGEFGTTHHRLFKRFKHAGMPIFSGNVSNSNPGFLEGFEFCNMVSDGPHPLRDVIPIPYSKEALESYRIVIHGIYLVVKDMVKNRIICIQRNLKGLIPDQIYNLTSLSSEEVRLMNKIVNDFYNVNHAKKITISSNYNLTINKEKIAWYLTLRDFLDECKKRKDIQDKYNNEQC
jgi:hypothetical protein